MHYSLDLQEIDFDRRLAVEEGNQDPDLALVQAYTSHGALKSSEGAIDDPHLVAGLSPSPAATGSSASMRRMIRSTSSWRRGVGLVADADETRHARRVSHHVPGLFVQDHLNEDIAGKMRRSTIRRWPS